jgi:hypothetical protein
MIVPFNGETRLILNAIADGLLPLHTWCKAKGRGDCEDRRPSRLGTLEFIESLITQWDSTGNPGRLWNQRVKILESDPLQLCPIDDPVYWRTERGLNSSTKFGISESGNLDVDRADFYGRYIPEVVRCAKARLPAQPPWADDELEKFGRELFEGSCPNWPAQSGLNSKDFVKRFLIDVMAALMSMQRIGSPRPFALLEAMNENRRVGNRFDTAFAEAAVISFKHALDQAMEWTP